MSSRVMPTTAIDVARGCFAEAVARGQRTATLCARFGISPEQLDDPEARLPATLTRRIWEELPILVGAPNDFGLCVARRAQAESAFGLLGHVLRSAETVREGLRSAIRYHRLLSNVADPQWRETPDLVRFPLIAREPLHQGAPHAVEFIFATIVLLLRDATRQPLTPRYITFRHARPDDDGEAQKLFACPITYCAVQDELAFWRADVELRIESADRYLSRLFQTRAAQLAQLDENIEKAPSFAARVQHDLTDSMQRGEVGLEDVARRLSMSARSLQRRLHDEGTSFAELVDGLRCDLAKRHLEEGKLNQQQIAFVLGFSDQSAFHRAFMRWTGSSPGAYRSAAKGGSKS